MGKSKRTDREITREQRLVKENQALKRENARLRKICARNEQNRYENVKEAAEEHGATTTDDLLDALKKEWSCRLNGCSGFLEIFLFNKLDTTWYLRKCTECSNRTKTQRYTPDVKGILKKT